MAKDTPKTPGSEADASQKPANDSKAAPDKRQPGQDDKTPATSGQVGPKKEAPAPDKPADKGKAAQGKEAAPPAAGEVVVSFDKINEIANDRKAAGEQAAAKDKSGPDKPAAADKGKAAQDKQAAPPAPAAAKGKDAEKPPASTDKGRISSIEFPSGKKLVIEDAAKPQDKAPAADKQAKATDPAVEGDTLDDWKREEQAAQAKKPRQRKAASKAPASKEKSPAAKDKPPAAAQKSSPASKGYDPDFPPTPPRTLQVEAPRPGEPEKIVYLPITELHPFKDHPFQVRDDSEMRAMVESVKDKGVTQPAIVRPREGGGYEIVSGHRRQRASEVAGYKDMPCIVRKLTDEQAITQMVEDNTNQREAILPSERAKALKMQLEAIKRQGSRADLSGQTGKQQAENGKRTNQVVADRNKMTVKQVQRYIKLNELVPELMKMVDEKKIAFTPAVELAFIGPKNQNYIAVAIEGQASAPSLSQAQRMRELDQKGMLNNDVIDGIMLEEKKEVDKVILNSQELSKYFTKGETPREMKDTILKLLDSMKSQQKDVSKPEKKAEQEK